MGLIVVFHLLEVHILLNNLRPEFEKELAGYQSSLLPDSQIKINYEFVSSLHHQGEEKEEVGLG